MSTPTNHTTSYPHYLSSQGDRVNPPSSGQAQVLSGTFCGKTTRQSKATCSLHPGEATRSGATADHLQQAGPSLSSRASTPEKTDSFQFSLLPAELQYMILRKLPPLDAIKLYPALAAVDENKVCIDSLLNNINPKTYSGIEKLAEKQRRELEKNARLALSDSPSPALQNLYPYIQKRVSGTGQAVLYSLLVKNKQLVNPTRIDGLDRVSFRERPRCSALLSTSQFALSTRDGSVNIYATQPPEGPLQPLKVLHHYLPGEEYLQRVTYNTRAVLTIKKISAECLVTASLYRIKLWDMTASQPTDFKIIEFDSYIIHLDFTDKFLSVRLNDGTVQRISLSSGDEGKLLAEYRFYPYPSFLAGDNWHQANPRAEKLIDLVSRDIIGNGDREAAIKWINDKKVNFCMKFVKQTDSQIFIQKFLDFGDIDSEIAVFETHHLNKDADNITYSSHLLLKSFPNPSLFLKTGDWVVTFRNKITFVNNRQPANPTCSIALSNRIHQVIELTNGFLACTGHKAIYIVNPNQPDIIVDTLLPTTKRLNSNPSKFCESYLISNTLMLTTTTPGDKNAVIWDLSDIVENHHPEASVHNPGGPAVDQEVSGQQRPPIVSSAENSSIQSNRFLTSWLGALLSKCRLPGIPVHKPTTAPPGARQPIATIELPDQEITGLQYIHDGKAIMVYENPAVADETKVCIWDFFADPLFLAKLPAKKPNSNSSP